MNHEGELFATGRLRGSQMELEVGVKLDADGTPRIVSAVPDDVFDLDAAGVSPLKAAIAEYAGSVVNDKLIAGAKQLLADPQLLPKMLMMLLGAHFSYQRIGFVVEDIVLDYVAPVEADPKPRTCWASEPAPPIKLPTRSRV